MQFGLEQRTALVCGGSSGLGKAIARELLDEGARVAVNGRDPAKLGATVDELRRDGSPEVIGIHGDVSAPADAEAIVARVIRQWGSLDILLCNAGGPPPGSFEDFSADQWQAAINLNLLSTINLCRAALPSMRARHWGRILCVTSVAAKQPSSGLILSTTARAGVLGFAKALSDEVAPDGITVNVLCPGYIATDRLRELAAVRAKKEGRTQDDMLAQNASAVPARRVGTPEEFAAAAVFLASTRASYVTGTALSIDGGLHRSIL
ncbi:MAG: SDR family oxidoreductase [Gemmatimonadota bacterium]